MRLVEELLYRFRSLITFLLTVSSRPILSTIDTALLYIHDHLINAIDSQRISHFCCIDLFAASDTINHVCHLGLIYMALL